MPTTAQDSFFAPYKPTGLFLIVKEKRREPLLSSIRFDSIRFGSVRQLQRENAPLVPAPMLSA